MTDGTYSVRLILRDRAGRVSREAKSFVISSHPPLVRVRLDSSRVHPGNQVPLRVQASATTRTISARLYGAEPVFLHWDETRKASTGLLSVPPSLPPGRYSIHVTAEDVAHNVSREEVPIEVLP
jgi:Ca-activated chloride channel homolog